MSVGKRSCHFVAVQLYRNDDNISSRERPRARRAIAAHSSQRVRRQASIGRSGARVAAPKIRAESVRGGIDMDDRPQRGHNRSLLRGRAYATDVSEIANEHGCLECATLRVDRNREHIPARPICRSSAWRDQAIIACPCTCAGRRPASLRDSHGTVRGCGLAHEYSRGDWIVRYDIRECVGGQACAADRRPLDRRSPRNACQRVGAVCRGCGERRIAWQRDAAESLIERQR